MANDPGVLPSHSGHMGDSGPWQSLLAPVSPRGPLARATVLLEVPTSVWLGDPLPLLSSPLLSILC